MTTTAPSGVVTFLCTDVEGSIRRWEADADGIPKALVAHAAPRIGLCPITLRVGLDDAT
jgi:hypothetical protein